LLRTVLVILVVLGTVSIFYISVAGLFSLMVVSYDLGSVEHVNCVGFVELSFVSGRWSLVANGVSFLVDDSCIVAFGALYFST
jgi:hypothetical protein